MVCIKQRIRLQNYTGDLHVTGVVTRYCGRANSVGVVNNLLMGLGIGTW